MNAFEWLVFGAVFALVFWGLAAMLYRMGLLVRDDPEPEDGAESDARVQNIIDSTRGTL